MDRDDPLLVADQAAATLNVKPGTIYDWVSKGILPCVRILAGKRRPVIRFRRSDIDEFIRTRTIRGQMEK
jgi:excisionase family DNA binding protein